MNRQVKIHMSSGVGEKQGDLACCLIHLMLRKSIIPVDLLSIERLMMSRLGSAAFGLLPWSLLSMVIEHREEQ